MQRSNRDQVLDAVGASIRAVGLRRTTMADVARRAGLSRTTLYTHFTDVTQAAAALLTRELLTLLAEGADGGDGPARARIVATAVRLAAEIPDNPLIERVLELDGELLMPYLVTKLGSSQRSMLDSLRAVITDGQADGSVRAGDPALLAFSAFLVTQSFVVSSRIAEAEHGRAAVLDELALILDRMLAP